AGVTMNLIFAIVLYAGLYMTAGEPRPAITAVDSVSAAVLPPGTEALREIHRGDRITAVNGKAVRTWDELEEGVLKGRDTIRLEIAGRAQPLELRFATSDETVRAQALRTLHPLLPAKIGLVSVGQPAARANGLIARGEAQLERLRSEEHTSELQSPYDLV